MSKRTAAASTKIKKAAAQAAADRAAKDAMIDIILTDPDEPFEPLNPDPTLNMSAEEAKAFLNPKTPTHPDDLDEEDRAEAERLDRKLAEMHGEGPPWDDPNLPLAKGTRTVTLIRDHVLSYPELYLEVFIAGTRNEERMFAEMFTRAGCSRAKSLEEADLCVFTGGVDVDPVLYGETPHPRTHILPVRDQADMLTYKTCLHAGIPMFGVCRGMQFLHVMNGGRLFQDIDGHWGDHSIRDITEKTTIDKVSSVHHQSCQLNRDGGMKIVATAAESKERWINAKTKANGPNIDIEALWYRETCCFGVQGHPEYKDYAYYTVWCLKKLNEYVMLNPDVDWVGGRRRVLPDLVAQREQNFAKANIKGVK